MLMQTGLTGCRRNLPQVSRWLHCRIWIIINAVFPR